MVWVLADCFFFYLYGDHRDLHSFPTRRSSDLPSTGSPGNRKEFVVNLADSQTFTGPIGQKSLGRCAQVSALLEMSEHFFRRPLSRHSQSPRQELVGHAHFESIERRQEPALAHIDEESDFVGR